MKFYNLQKHGWTLTVLRLNKSDKEKKILYDIIYVWNIEKKSQTCRNRVNDNCQGLEVEDMR